MQQIMPTIRLERDKLRISYKLKETQLNYQTVQSMKWMTNILIKGYEPQNCCQIIK